MSILTAEDKAFFAKNGYVVVKNAVPKPQCDRLVETMWAFLGKAADDRESWYTPPQGMDNFWPRHTNGMLPLYNHQTMWDNRQHPRLYEAFSELLGEEKLWVSHDRVNLKPPKRGERGPLNPSFIHWDADTTTISFPLPQPRPVQGVLYLSDTSADQGGFQCVPSLYRELEQWLKTQPADRSPTHPDVTGFEIEEIEGGAGDLIIWDVLLPHGSSENWSDKVRLAQYITMFPQHSMPVESRNPIIESWSTNQPLPSSMVDPRGWELAHNGGPAQLTPLGRKLIGLDPW